MLLLPFNRRILSLRTAATAATASSLFLQQQCRGLVSLHGFSTNARMSIPGANDIMDRPPDPHQLFKTSDQFQEQVDRLLDWFENDGKKKKKQVLCLTGAGLSTASGIPDYRGHDGSYHKGHKPMLHEQFMSSEYQRKRYWGRGMVGWRAFDDRTPNMGHVALAELERMGILGVSLEDRADFYPDGKDDVDWVFGVREPRTLSLITQNVDSFHRKAGSQHMVDLHGRLDRLRCMQCGTFQDRRSFHTALESLNREWLAAALKEASSADLRPDGDAAVQSMDYASVHVPSCKCCGDGFLKPDVVFFGDNVPKHRVALCQAAVDAADGLLVVGSSLAVHSAFRHVRAASHKGIPIAILNVGTTRAETEGLPVLKVEAPAGPTLAAIASHFSDGERSSMQQVSGQM